MATGDQKTPSETNPDPTASAVEGCNGPGGGYVPLLGIVPLALYLVVAIALCLYGLIVLWPVPTPAGTQQPATTTTQINSTTNENAPTKAQPPQPAPAATPAPTPGIAHAFGYDFEIWDEVRLLWIVMLAGALGSLVHALRSVSWYVGNRNLVWSWMGKYLLIPFSGSALAVVFYFVIRGGFFSPQSGFSQTSPFGFAAMAALVGLFSEPAVMKLKLVAETVFTAPGQGANSTPQPAVQTAPPEQPATTAPPKPVANGEAAPVVPKTDGN
jgi:hypothetical protein